MNNSKKETLKKSYSAPAAVVVSIEMENLLAGSGKITGTVEDYKGWGNIDNNDAKGNDASLWDEDEYQD